MVIALFLEHGTRWSKIAKHLPHRTSNQIKNRYNSSLKKRFANNEFVELVIAHNLTEAKKLQDIAEQIDNRSLSYTDAKCLKEGQKVGQTAVARQAFQLAIQERFAEEQAQAAAVPDTPTKRDRRFDAMREYNLKLR